MAGAGAKLFTSGSVLTADQVNTYLMDQTIMKFASTSARDAAFGGAGEPTLAEGMFAYTTDTDTLWFYTGSAWEVATIKPSIVDAKGDLLVGTAADTLARQGVGANGSILMADSSQTNGVTWSTAQTSGRNYIINGGFDVWQRGTSFSNPADAAFTADRFFVVWNGSGATRTISQGQFDPYQTGASVTATPPTGLTPKYFLRWNQSVAGTTATYNILYANRVEDVRRLAGKTMTISFYAKAGASLTMPKIDIEQSFGTGGSPSSAVYTDVTTNVAVTTSWQRFSYSFTVPSTAGKTMGTADNSYTSIRLWLPVNATFTYDVWGVQLEDGAVATPFEFEDYGITLAKCQRYYQKSYSLPTNPATATTDGIIYNTSSSNAGNDFVMKIELRVEMRTGPTVTLYNTAGSSGTWTYTRSGVAETATTMAVVYQATNGFCVYGGVGATYVVCQAYGHYVATAEL